MVETDWLAMSCTTVRFVDTNVVLYASSTSIADTSKAVLAKDVLRESDLALSVQVLQEFYWQATRETRVDKLSHEQAWEQVEALTRYPVQEITVPLVARAIQSRQRFGISYWDAAIIEAARMLGCAEVLSEDLSDGQDYGGVTVRNPFASP